MTQAPTPTPYEIASNASGELSDVKSRISALERQRASLTVDPSGSVESQVRAKQKSEEKINADLSTLTQTRDILPSRLGPLWLEANTYLRSRVNGLGDKARAAAESEDKTSIRILDALCPSANGAHLWTAVRSLRSSSAAWKLHAELEEARTYWCDGSQHATEAYANQLAKAIEAYPAKAEALQALSVEMEKLAAELEKRFASLA